MSALRNNKDIKMLPCCGSMYSRHNYARHIKTKKHLDYIRSQQTVQSQQPVQSQQLVQSQRPYRMPEPVHRRPVAIDLDNDLYDRIKNIRGIERRERQHDFTEH